jgi:hypothetical protein
MAHIVSGCSNSVLSRQIHGKKIVQFSHNKQKLYYVYMLIVFPIIIISIILEGSSIHIQIHIHVKALLFAIHIEKLCVCTQRERTWNVENDVRIFAKNKNSHSLWMVVYTSFGKQHSYERHNIVADKTNNLAGKWKIRLET